jgi:hypothetical protein
MMVEAIGWVATVVFATSYFFRDQKTLRLVQAIAACLWLSFGLAIHSAPVIASNVIVIFAALYSRSRALASQERD